MKRMAILFLVLFTMQFYLSSIEITGTGYGDTREESKKYALADLSSYIEIEVKSEAKEIIREIEKNNNSSVSSISESIVQVKSDLPLLGVEFVTVKSKNKFITTAILNSNKSLPLYKMKLIELKKELDKDIELSKKNTDQNQKYQILMRMYSNVQLFQKFKIVTIFLKSLELPQINITLSEIRSKISELEQNFTSLDLACRKIGSELHNPKTFVFPPITGNSSEITQLAKIIKNLISQYTQTVETPDLATYFLKGNYELINDGINGIVLTYQLLNLNHEIINTRLIKLSPKSYSDYTYKPKSQSFENLLKQGFVVTNDFKIEVTTNYGKNDLLLIEDNELELLVKMNQPGYFYAVGHILKNQEKFSYLVELNYGTEYTDNDRFIKFIGPDNINKWISLGKFLISEPFGIESVQFIASNSSLSEKIPSHYYHENSGYFIIANDPEKGIIKTRGLKPVKKNKILSAEDVLFFTTMKK
ncbi:MAG: hypothetical protein MJB14_19360 [Spirochaetes bacterium]|nr:hypothetical protein [Spirochaetota bacterium]